MRQAAVLMVALVLAGAASGTTEIALHGLPFFSSGTREQAPATRRTLTKARGPGSPTPPEHIAPHPQRRRAARPADTRRADAVC
jgi:hypothetical protein